MNIYESDILMELFQSPFATQRKLANQCHCSLGVVNAAIHTLRDEGYINEEMALTAQAQQLLGHSKPQRAVILAAGYGMRMAPINHQVPKGLLTVHGQTLIERTICQLHQVGIHEIHVVVGFMKEKYEYLIDTYGVHLIVNAQYSTTNNLHSLYLAQKYLANAYVIPCDLWFSESPFRTQELYAWYAVSQATSKDSAVRVNRKREFVPSDSGNRMIGVSYLDCATAEQLCAQMDTMIRDSRYDNAFWEGALFHEKNPLLRARILPDDMCVEINTYEQLRDLDSHSSSLKSDAISAICRSLRVSPEDVSNITILKKGMTNRSFLFQCQTQQYIMRVPGEGTDALINRQQEAAVYNALSSKSISDDIIYIDPSTGYKITVFWNDARVCDPENWDDVGKCMNKLRAFHEQAMTVDHTFDLWHQIDFYESLWPTPNSIYRDYEQTKAKVLSLRTFLETHASTYCLTHIDAVPDNFLFIQGNHPEKEIRLIDWEYAGMQDPHVDIAMFCIYSLYDRTQVDRVIDLYFEGHCSDLIRAKIYGYISVCGLLWSNWCEYKHHLGVEFGEYSLKQYRYAKEYYAIATAAISAVCLSNPE